MLGQVSSTCSGFVSWVLLTTIPRSSKSGCRNGRSSFGKLSRNSSSPMDKKSGFPFIMISAPRHLLEAERGQRVHEHCKHLPIVDDSQDSSESKTTPAIIELGCAGFPVMRAKQQKITKVRFFFGLLTDATASEATAFQRVFFAPLREKCFLYQKSHTRFEYFLCKAAGFHSIMLSATTAESRL
jgi:hypothetical protein